MTWRTVQRRGLAPATVLLLAFGCTTPTDDLAPALEAAKGGPGGGGDPVVDAADPAGAPQDTTLDVRVLGSNFDRGSVVEFELDEQPTAFIRTNSTKYRNSGELIANVTVSADAAATLYDIAVTTAGGKKGIGIEKFTVRPKGNPNAEIVLHSIPELGSSTDPGVYGDGQDYIGGARKDCDAGRGVFLVPPEGMPSDLNLPPVCPDDGRSQIQLPPDPLAGNQDTYGTPVPVYIIRGNKVQPRGWMGPAVDYYWAGCVGPDLLPGCNFLWTDAKVIDTQYDPLTGAVVGSTVTGECAKLYIGADTLQVSPAPGAPRCDSVDKAGNPVDGFPIRLHVVIRVQQP